MLFICTLESWIFGWFVQLFKDVFVAIVYFGFNIWNAAAAYFDIVTIEQFTKFMAWGKVFSYKI